MIFLRFRLSIEFFFYADDRCDGRKFPKRVRGARNDFFFTHDTLLLDEGGHCATITRRNIRGRAPAILRAIGTT